MILAVVSVALAQAPAEPVPAVGALRRDQIDGVIRARMNQIRYCYQRELIRDPLLSGFLSVKFTIGKDGAVATAETGSSTLPPGSTVPACVNDRFRALQFPPPVGGGIVIVTYPFVFSPTETVPLPPGTEAAVRACVVDLAPVRASVALEVAVQRASRKEVANAQVLLASTDPGDRRACLMPAFNGLKGAKGWTWYEVPAAQ